MSPSPSTSTCITLSCVLLVVTVQLVYTAPNADHDRSRVVWVPVMERNNGPIATAIGSVLQDGDAKTARIGQMLNKSYSTQEKVALQGAKELEKHKDPNQLKTAEEPSSAPSSSLTVFNAFFGGLCLVLYAALERHVVALL